MITEDSVENFSNILSEYKVYDDTLNESLIIDDNYEIHVRHEKIENDECVFSISLYDKTKGEQVDNVYCDIDKEQIEDIIYFFIDEYVDNRVD